MLHNITTKKNINDAGAALEKALAKYQFSLLAVHDLKAKMNAKGVPFDEEVRVYEVCKPAQAKEILSATMDISSLLPCRVSAFTRGGETVLSTVKPTALVGMFQKPELQKVAEEVERELVAAMEEAV
jgi:uncharacterized protein (DUF302 family)